MLCKARILTGDYVPQKSPEDILFTKMIQNVLVRVVPASVKRSEVAVSCKLGLIARFVVGSKDP